MAEITSVKIHVLKIPVKIRLSTGRVGETSHLITEVHTDNGVVGFGEGTPYVIRAKSMTNIYNCYMLCRKIVKKLEGKQLSDARDLLPQMQNDFMEKSSFDYGPFLALETSIIDAISKSDEVPFAEILGGSYRDRVPVSGTVFLSSPKNMAKTAQRWVSKGVMHLKVKVVGKNEVDSTNLKYIRDAVGFDPLIRIDANGAYETADKATEAINNLERYKIAIVEQPILWDDLKGLRKLRRVVAPKVMVDESLKVPLDVELISEKEVADIINFHPSKLGCLSVTREAIERTVDLGLEYMIGSAVMTGIGVAAHLHLAASMEKLHYPNEEIGLYEMFSKDIVANPLRIVNGCIEVPRDYGVGVRIDGEKMKEYNVNTNYIRGFFICAAYRGFIRSPSFVKAVARKGLSTVKDFVF